MEYLANTTTLVADGVIDPAQAQKIESRSRKSLIAHLVNVFLCGGIIAATIGLIFLLAEPLPVAIFGGLALVQLNAWMKRA